MNSEQILEERRWRRRLQEAEKEIGDLNVHVTEQAKKIVSMDEIIRQFHAIMITQVACTDLLMTKGVVTHEEIAAHLDKVAEESKHENDSDRHKEDSNRQCSGSEESGSSKSST